MGDVGDRGVRVNPESLRLAEMRIIERRNWEENVCLGETIEDT